MVMPREGYLDQVYRMFFSSIPPDTDLSAFTDENWISTSYGECKEEISRNAPKPRGICFIMRVFVDSYNAGDLVTRRSRPDFLIF